MKASDIEAVLSVSTPTLDPSRRRAVVSVTRPSLLADAVVGQLWSVALDGSGTRRITRGFRDTAPRFSPDGSLIAFLRATPDAPPQLHVVAADGGEPVVVTDARLGVSAFDWSPDGTQLAYVARVPEQGRYGTVESLGADAEAPRTFTSLRYRQNGIGYHRDRRAHVFLVDVPDVAGEPHIEPVADASGKPPHADDAITAPLRLTHDDVDYSSPRFTPDGAAVAVVASRHPERENDLRSSVWSVPLDGGEPAALLDWPHTLSVSTFAFDAAGALLVIAQDVGESGRDFIARNATLYRVVDGTATAVTDAESVDLGESASVTPAPDGSVLVLNRTRGTVQLVRVDRDGTHQTLTSGDSTVTGVAVDDDAIVVSYADAFTAGDVATVSGQVWTQISDFGSALRRTGIVAGREHVIAARDGYPVHGWSFVPETYDETVPVLLMIHGGPYAAYAAAFFDEAQVLADAGYGVVMCNPRGSAGYGQEHGRVIRQRMGTVDEGDVLDFLDGVLAAEPRFDGSRVGIMGGSYGGFLTAWITTNEHRFSAAIVERGYLDPAAFVGTSDIGDFFADEYAGTDPERVAAQSPQAHVGTVSTPTLVLHSEQDHRCPLSQAERYYAALVRSGVDAEFTVFPGENHELSRSGRPRHRVQRFDVILDWWARHLPSSLNPA